jgi:imidazolonepropionase-like amidohydrolase
MGEDRGWKPNQDYEKQMETITDYFDRTKAFISEKPSVPNQAIEALVGTLDGRKKVYVYADGVREIMDAVSQLKQHGVEQIVLVGGYQADEIIPFLKRHNISVLVNRVHSLPEQADDDYDKPYKLPVLLTQGGLTVGLNARGSMERMSTRNLPFYAGHTSGFGLSSEEALKLITSNTAKILGIDADYGTLEIGKSATLFVSQGDALDMRTNRLSHAFIDGRQLSLESHQTELFKRYANKYGQQTQD